MCENLPDMEINKEVKGLMGVPQERGKRNMKGKDNSRGRGTDCTLSSPSWVGRLGEARLLGNLQYHYVRTLRMLWLMAVGYIGKSQDRQPQQEGARGLVNDFHLGTACLQMSCLHIGTYLICLITFLTYFKYRKIICLNFDALTVGTMSVD